MFRVRILFKHRSVKAIKQLKIGKFVPECSWSQTGLIVFPIGQWHENIWRVTKTQFQVYRICHALLNNSQCCQKGLQLWVNGLRLASMWLLIFNFFFYVFITDRILSKTGVICSIVALDVLFIYCTWSQHWFTVNLNCFHMAAKKKKKDMKITK